MKLVVIILTHNEERHIEECIKSAAFADEILVIDDESTDRTAELARAQGARVVERPLAGDFAAQRNFALTQTDADWVLYVDADERIAVVQFHHKIGGQQEADSRYDHRRMMQTCDNPYKSSR